MDFWFMEHDYHQLSRAKSLYSSCSVALAATASHPSYITVTPVCVDVK